MSLLDIVGWAEPWTMDAAALVPVQTTELASVPKHRAGEGSKKAAEAQIQIATSL